MTSKIKNLLQYLLTPSGYEIVPKDPFLSIEREFTSIYETCKDYTMTSKERMYALHKSVEYIVNAKIPGDLVESGVWKGGSSMLIACTLLQMKETQRKVYLYDTFEGMSKPTQMDKRISDSFSAINEWKNRQKKNYSDWCYSPLSEVQHNMISTGYPQENLVFIKGKVEDTIPGTRPVQIALLRLDTDWYESTYHELCHLYPLLSDRGVLIIDDYGYWEGAKRAVDKYFQENNIRVLLNRIDYTCRLVIK